MKFGLTNHLGRVLLLTKHGRCLDKFSIELLFVFILFYSLLQIYEHILKVMNNIKSVCLMQVKYTIRQ